MSIPLRLCAVALALSPLPLLAAEGLDGEWCSAAGERLLIDAAGPGFNEHTVCQWLEGRPEAAVFDAAIACANVYPSGDTLVTTEERMGRLVSDGTAPITIFARFEADDPVAFKRCAP
ncbi:hypothetical protein SAMN02983003_2251 [Devosia enhydra]|uniref:Uncharacterized protein n=1 Tax=Devosia enhydra TaxID=665118 RepID=A0A1K2HY79_9HYPH|nr:hypothetical protein [Devosia enhydra]SFZ84859.1 hypothetical protein SAMN02983003_2251 [Devosia enhydra]